MAKKFAKSFYNSGIWKRTRKSFISYRISVDGGMCQMCKEQPGYIVDHKKELTPDNINDPDISLSFNNFQYLCLVCHNKKTFAEETNTNYFFDNNGQVQPILPP